MTSTDTPPTDESRPRLQPGLPTFHALRHRNFRLFWSGQIVSLVGTWMQTTAQAWLVYDLSRSPFLLGVVGLASSLPVLILSVWGGVVADRMSKRRLLLITQAAALVQALLMAILAYSGLVQVWHVVVLAFFLGAITAFDAPARQAFVPEMVGTDDVMNAVALNSISFNAARIAGPALAGVLTAVAGVNICFLLNAVSFVAILGGLLMMTPGPRPAARPPAATPFADVREVFGYVRRTRLALGLVLVTALSSLLAFPFVQLMPVVAREVLHVGAQGYGALLSATGVGALIGAGTAATFGRKLKRGRYLLAGTILLPASLVAFSLSTSYALSLVALVGAGWGMIAQTVTANTLLQTSTPEVLRGRVMSLYTLTVMGLAPLGTLQAGALAEHIGAPWALGGGAVLFAVLGLWIHHRMPELRRS